MESLDIIDDQDCKRKYKEEESEVELKFYKSELKTEIKSEPLVNAESDMMNIKVEYPIIVVDDSNHNQFICETELHSEIKKSIKTEEVIESLESGDRIGFKREKEDKDTTLVDMDLEYFEAAPRILQNGNNQHTFQREEYETGPYDPQQRLDEYCFMCQEFGHVMTSECIICFNCGVKGHSRRDCPYDTQVSYGQSLLWIHNNVVDDHNGNVPAKSCLQIEDNAKLNMKELEAKKVDDEEVSDDMAYACKTSCQICHKVFTPFNMRAHTIKVHNLQIARYKEIYGNFVITKPMYHKCHLCGKIILLDNEKLGGHMNGVHKMRVKVYKAQFMTLVPKKRMLGEAAETRSDHLVEDLMLPASSEGDVPPLKQTNKQDSLYGKRVKRIALLRKDVILASKIG